MENEQLVQAKKWKQISNVAWWHNFFIIVGVAVWVVGICLILNGTTSWLMTNSAGFLAGTVIAGMYFFGGWSSALSASAISTQEYLRRKRNLKWLVGCLSISACALLFHLMLLRSGMPIFGDSQVTWSQLPGLIYLLAALIINPMVWELFWLKRLGKVDIMTEVPNGK